MFDKFSDRRPHIRPGIALPVGVALLLVSGNLTARLVLRLLAPDDQDDLVFGMVSFGVSLLIAALVAAMWTRRYLLARVAGYVAAAAVGAALVIGSVGPWVSGEPFGDGGATIIVQRMLVTLVVIVTGGIMGTLSTVALGRDVISRAWRAHTDQVLTKGK